MTDLLEKINIFAQSTGYTPWKNEARKLAQAQEFNFDNFENDVKSLAQRMSFGAEEEPTDEYQHLVYQADQLYLKYQRSSE